MAAEICVILAFPPPFKLLKGGYKRLIQYRNLYLALLGVKKGRAQLGIVTER